MDCESAIHAHKQQKHVNGKKYNKQSIITKSLKHWNARDEYWKLRNAKACFNVQILNSHFQCGGNTIETDHANILKWFGKWMKSDGMGLDIAIAWNYLITLKVNAVRTRTMISKSKEKGNASPWNNDWLNEVYKVYDDIHGLNDLKRSKDGLTRDNNYHGYIHFKQNDTSIKEYLNGIYYIFIICPINLHTNV